MLTLSLTVLGLTLNPAPDSMLVSTAWLAERMKQPGLVLFQIGTQDEFTAAHIPGAQFLSIRNLAAPRGDGPALELPTPEAAEAWLEAHGVSEDSRIVLYWGSDWISPTTRMYLTLYWAGLGDRTSILDGGMGAWRAEGRPVTTDTAVVRPGQLTLRPRSDVVVAAAEVEQLRTRPDVAVIDARNTQFYLGQDTNHVRPGHIPGARNLVFDQLTGDDPYRFKSRDVLAELLKGAGAAPGKRVIAYCHIGQQATVVWFAAKLVGYDVRLYDGSFTEWTGLSQYPVERSNQP
jgi:thiosulfate/3-mercaptopyruvate sulfurtransferase